ncbi:MAG: sulfur carrier protein ThiS [Bacteroidales bacterium]|nr:sulfur carrier protein ThiS [Bacteroidales bacterium]
MKIVLNKKEIELKDNSTITMLIENMSIVTTGIAIAVNNKVIRRNEWQNYILKDNDKVIVIKAVCGG